MLLTKETMLVDTQDLLERSFMADVQVDDDGDILCYEEEDLASGA